MHNRIAVLFSLLALVGLSTATTRAQAKPLKVFILAGQSNMQGHAHIRTFDVIGMDPQTAPLLKKMRNADGQPRVCQEVYISSIGSSDEERVGKLTAGYGAQARGPKIGPEFTFGIYMHELLDEPILIIKTAWGGKSLNTDFRPPSAGPYKFNETQLKRFTDQGKDVAKIKAAKAEATGRYYRLMMEHVKKVLGDVKRVYPDYDEKQGYKLAGFVWFQGWNDMVDGGTYAGRGKPGSYDKYTEVLAHFIRDVRKDLDAPRLPFVIGVMGVGGPTKLYEGGRLRYKNIHQEFRDAMAAPAKMPEFKGNVAAVLTEKYWDLKVTALKERDVKLQKKIRELESAGKLNRKQRSEELDKLRAKEFTPRELILLTQSTSNAGFHYMGSAKIMAQIGKGFAEAMFELLKEGDQQ